VWINAFAKKIPSLWQANTDAQFILDAYVAVAYSSFYMTKLDRSMKTSFKQIRENCISYGDNKIETIRKLGNTLINMQQMSSRQVVHISLSLSLYSTSRKTIFINTIAEKKHMF